MSVGEVFVDTNVFVYALDLDEQEKSARARHILEAHTGSLVVSTQVLIELHRVCSATLGMSAKAAAGAVRDASRLNVVPADRELILSAADLASSEQISIFDAAILAAASRAGCTTLLSEDFQHGRDYDGLYVVNPFRD